MGGFAGIDQICPGLIVILAVLVAIFALYFFLATRQIKDCKTLPERRKQYQKIAIYSFLSAPLAFFLSILPLNYAWRIPSLVYTPLAGIALGRFSSYTGLST